MYLLVWVSHCKLSLFPACSSKPTCFNVRTFKLQALLGIGGRIFFVRREDFLKSLTFKDGEGQEEEKEGQKLVAEAEWRQLGVITDRFLFLIFLVIVLITTCV
jgi:hypothetical protein